MSIQITRAAKQARVFDLVAATTASALAIVSAAVIVFVLATALTPKPVEPTHQQVLDAIRPPACGTVPMLPCPVPSIR